MTPGFAALLYGWVNGKSPTSTDDLVASNLLHKDELKHAGGAAIEWRPGEPARSTWGTPASLTPLVELPPPDLVTESERAAYDRFSRTYETYWSRYIDPAALRITADGATIAAHLRVLPLIEGTDYRDILELAGPTRVTAPPIADGVRAAFGIGPGAKLRRELSSLASGNLGRHGFKLDFLGDWAMVGIADRKRIADVAKNLRTGIPELPEPEPTRHVDEIAEATKIPAYAAVEIKSPSGAALALAALRRMADETLRGMLSWSEVGTEHGSTIFRVGVESRAGASDNGETARAEAPVFYALTDKALFLSFDEAVLRSLVVDGAEGRGPTAPREVGAPRARGSQMVFDLAGKRDGGLFTVLGWLLSEQLVRASSISRAQAEAVLRGSPERSGDAAATHALSIAYFGAAPVPPHGGAYTLAGDGVHDPVLGSASSPRWPPLPVTGSTVDKLIGAVGRFRSEIAFDPEGRDPKNGRALQSLRVRAEIGLRER
jgi:hypothetical protein